MNRQIINIDVGDWDSKSALVILDKMYSLNPSEQATFARSLVGVTPHLADMLADEINAGSNRKNFLL